MTTPTYQIGGFYDLNKNIVANISLPNNDPSLTATVLGQITSQLNEIDNAYKSINANVAPIVSHQYNVVDLLEKEKRYLEQQAKNIDEYTLTQQKKIKIQMNSQKRSQYISYILIVLIITLICYLVISFLVPYPFYIPLSFLLFLGSGVYVAYLIYEFNKRDINDFDKLRD